MLSCDAEGRVCTPVIPRPVYERARASARSIGENCQNFATIGLEIGPGKFIPAAVEIDDEELWALEHALEHALKNDRVPDILTRHIRPIVTLERPQRDAILAEYKKQNRRPRIDETSKVLNRLPYYSEEDVEFSVPLYKAEYTYPLVMLRIIPTNKNNPKSACRLLVLDSDGDIGAIKVPRNLVDTMVKGLAAKERKTEKPVCVTITQQSKGMGIDYLPISQSQKRALETVAKRFEETGTGKHPLSAAARMVLIRAKDLSAAPAQ